MKQHAAFWLMTSAAITVGFVVGYGVGQGTREAMPGHVKTSVDGGTVTITANLTGALKDGALGWLSEL